RRGAAGARGLTGIGAGLRRPQRVEPLRVYTQRSVPSDGVSEAGPSGAQVASLFAGFADVEIVQVGDLRLLNWESVPRAGRRPVLGSTHRDRYDNTPSRAWRPDLHLALWNPFQVLDIAAPAVVTWGYADGALAALREWLEGSGALPGHAPVHLTPAA